MRWLVIMALLSLSSLCPAAPLLEHGDETAEAERGVASSVGGEEKSQPSAAENSEGNEGKENNPGEQPTFSAVVERLDAPLETIEIRLIDEKNQSAASVESAALPPPLSPMTPAAASAPDASPHAEEAAPTETNYGAQEPAPPVASEAADEAPRTDDVPTDDDQYHDKYKKVEYMSDTALVQPPPAGSRGEEAQAAAAPAAPASHSASEDATAEATGGEAAHETRRDDSLTPAAVDEATLQRTQLANALAAAKTRSAAEASPADDVRDEDLPVFGDGNNDDSDDEPEPVEECLTNRESLSAEVVERLQAQAERLSKMIRKLNKQQTQYCQDKVADGSAMVFTDHYSQCPLWREEKIVHYYKLMRITYCADYSKWPNGSKMQKTYGSMLPLYETLYAFSKQ